MRPPAPTSCNENIINYPTDRPLGCGAGNSLGLVFVDRQPPSPPPLTPREGKRERVEKRLYIHHWQGFEGDSVKGIGVSWAEWIELADSTWCKKRWMDTALSLLTQPFTGHLCLD